MLPTVHSEPFSALAYGLSAAKTYLRGFLIAACAERYSGRTFWTTAPYPSNRLAYDPNDNFPPFLTLHIGFQEAEKYRKQSGSYLSKNQWEDLTIDVYL